MSDPAGAAQPEPYLECQSCHKHHPTDYDRTCDKCGYWLFLPGPPEPEKPPEEVEPTEKPRAADARNPQPKKHWTTLFIRALREHGNISRASDEIGISRYKVYWRQKHDTKFAARVLQARERGEECLREKLIREVHDRAFNGCEDKASHLLLMFAMKAADPRFRDNYQPPVAASQDFYVDLSSDGTADTDQVGGDNLDGPEPD